MHVVYSYTSGYFSIYDDEYGRVHYDDYDDDDHVLHDTRGFSNLRTFDYGQITRLLWVQMGVNHLGTRSHVWVVYREVLYIQFCQD